MKKVLSIILVGILAALVFSIFNKEPIDEIELTTNLDEIVPPLTTTQEQRNSVNFRLCDEKDNFKIETGVETGKLTIVEKSDTVCLVELVYGIEGGYFINDCEIPFEEETIEFTDNNFDAISKYCHIRTSGEGLLELQ